MEKVSKKSMILYTAIVAVCFFYTGSAYMSQMYLLLDYYSYETVDFITSALNYGLQALGILLFIVGMTFFNNLFKRKNTFLALLILGTPAMIGMLLVKNGLLMVILGSVFNLLVGFYFGYYLTMMAAFVAPHIIGICYGISYAIASVGTYLVSLIDDGNFLTNDYISIVYVCGAIITFILVSKAEDLNTNDASLASDDQSVGSKFKFLIDKDSSIMSTLIWLIVIVFLMSAVSSLGSGLYLSLPGTSEANFTLARAFYAFGLIAAGFIMDKNRFVGSIITLASLTYPLVASSLLYNSGNGTFAMCLSYLFLGFIAVYRFVAYADLRVKSALLLPVAGLGLMVSRLVDVIIMFIMTGTSFAFNVEMIISVVIYSILLILFIIFITNKRVKEVYQMVAEKQESEAYADSNAQNTSQAMRDAILGEFSQRYQLTNRESEIVASIRDGLSDSEIAEKYNISKSTVRFHISNLLKKTECNSRVEVIRKLLQNK